VLASLNHPNIATIYGVEERAIVMELVEGERLAGPLPLKTALDYARQIAEALEYAHDRGVVHRDLKPANIKVTSEGRVKVLDFGLAKALTSDVPVTSSESSPTLTMRKSTSGVILGTAAYMSPEQAKGKTVDRRADIWAFGVVLMEMLTGRPMYTGETVSETLASVIKDQPDFGGLPRETPIPIRRLLRRCLDKDPHRRLRDIGEARIAIEDAGEGGSAEEPAAAPHPRRAFPWGVATVLAIALAVLAFVHFREFRGEPAVVRFTIAPPEKTAFNIMGPAVLSQDGSRIAFSATSADGMSRLWIRSLDAVNARPLAGTEGATFPFWSPDGAFLGFFAGGKLKKVDISGGRVVSICDAYTGTGGAWNQAGVIVFAPAGLAALQRVSASGGTPSPVTKLENSSNGHRWPWFLPDGRHFLYLSRNGPISSIRVGSIDSSEDKALFTNQFNAVYAQGHLVFLRDSNLMAQPFDTNHLATTGEAVPAVEGVQANLGWQRGVFSVSQNGLLIFGTGKSAGAQLAWFDRRGTPRGFLGNPGGEINETEFSPDRKYLTLAIIDPATRNRDIWIFDVLRGIPSRFTFDPAEERRAIWSPNGQTIVFNSARQGHFDLYRKAFRGAGAEERLYADESDKYPETWSPNSKFLLYETVSLDAQKKRALWILSDPGGQAAERKPAPFAPGPDNHSNGQFSPDGQWIAYQSDESARYEIYVAPFPGPGGKRQISTAGGDQPRWRGDGKEIFYMSPENRLMAADLSTGAVTPLFATPFVRAGGMNYDVSADGQRFLVRILPSRTDADPIAVVQNWVAGLKK